MTRAVLSGGPRDGEVMEVTGNTITVPVLEHIHAWQADEPVANVEMCTVHYVRTFPLDDGSWEYVCDGEDHSDEAVSEGAPDFAPWISDEVAEALRPEYNAADVRMTNAIAQGMAADEQMLFIRNQRMLRAEVVDDEGVRYAATRVIARELIDDQPMWDAMNPRMREEMRQELMHHVLDRRGRWDARWQITYELSQP